MHTLLPIFSLPGSSNDHLNKTLTKIFDTIEGENIETNTQIAWEILEKRKLSSDVIIISLDVKNLYNNVPLKEAVETALRRLYELISPPETFRKAMKKLLNLAVNNVHFKFNGLWYVQRDGLEMGDILAVMFTNLWLKEHESVLMKEKPKLTLLKEYNKKICCFIWFF